jgi:putative redox protein
MLPLLEAANQVSRRFELFIIKRERIAMDSVTLRWIEKHMMVVTDSHGHSVVVGRSPDPQYDWVGIKPSELLLMAAAACSSYDVVEILTKQREPLQELKVTCGGEQMKEAPYTFTKIHLHYIVTGAVNPERLEKAIRLSEEKYCSVISTLRPGVPVTSDYEILA